VVGDYAIVITSDGGVTWNPTFQNLAYLFNSVYFTSINIGYAVGSTLPGTDSPILKTINGGLTWDTLSSGTANILFSVFFMNTDTGYIVGSTGTILKTVDGGFHWIT
jgi:photosystem II stability/assembly factor-like uncharacterized protein